MNTAIPTTIFIILVLILICFKLSSTLKYVVYILILATLASGIYYYVTPKTKTSVPKSQEGDTNMIKPYILVDNNCIISDKYFDKNNLDTNQYLDLTTCLSKSIQKTSNANIEDFVPKLISVQNKLQEFMVWQSADGNWNNSELYKISDMINALKLFLHPNDFDGFRFYTRTHDISIINLFAFLSQCMKETIMYNVCDENNTMDGYPFSAACNDRDFTNLTDDCCKSDPTMTIIGETNATWNGAPPPLFCAPRSKTGEYMGNWNPSESEYNDKINQKIFTRPDEFIKGIKEANPQNRYYLGQNYGFPQKSTNPSNVEGCCWWGRGVIQTSGRCGIGKLNKVLRAIKYFKDDIDLCINPELICQDSNLRWISGLYYWVKDVQTYNRNNWNYINELEKFTNSLLNTQDKMKFIDRLRFSPNTFIYGVAGIVSRGCATPGKNGCNKFTIEDNNYMSMCFFRKLLYWYYIDQDIKIDFVDLVSTCF